MPRDKTKPGHPVNPVHPVQKTANQSDEVEETRAVYDRIAGEYFQHRYRREGLEPLYDRFARRLPAGSLVLDVGCGPGFDAAALRDRGLRAFGLDYSWGMLATGRVQVGGPTGQADMRRLPLARRSCDGLWVMASLLHLPRAQVPATLREFHRVLRPGGVLLLSVKGGAGEGWRQTLDRPGIDRFYTFWPADELNQVLETAGFQLVEQWENRVNDVRWLGRLAQR
jgi:SAM-dependent methyltransferase